MAGTNRQSRTVGDYVSLVRGRTYKGSLVGKPGPALLGLGSIEPGGGFRADYKTYGGECPDELMLYPGDIYASLKGATKDGKMIGSVARVPSSVPSGRLTQDTVKLVFHEPTATESNYLYWILRTPQYRSYCAGRAMGSAVVALSRADFLLYPVPEPTPTRKMLAALLDQIDDKIELNRRMSETLEAMARTLFKSWFIDFDPVRAKIEGDDSPHPDRIAEMFPSEFVESDIGQIPKGWTSGALDQIAEHPRRGVNPGHIAPSTPYFGLEHMPRRCIALRSWGLADGVESNKFAFKKGEILFGKLRPYFHKVGVAPVDGVCSTDIVVVAPRLPIWFGFVLSHASSEAFVTYTNSGSTGTKMPRTSWSEMARYPVAIPPVSLAAEFDRQVRPMVDRILTIVHESVVLSSLLDALLPKLISGEIRAKAVEQLLASAPV